MSSLVSAVLLLRLTIQRRAIDDLPTIVFDRSLSVKKMAQVESRTTDYARLDKSKSQNKFSDMGSKTREMKNNNGTTSIIYSKDRN